MRKANRKKGVPANSRRHQWAPSKSPKPNMKRVIPEGHPPPKKSGQGCSLPTISDGLPFALPFFLNSVPSVHLNILSLLHVLFVFVVLSGDGALCIVWLILGSLPL